MQINGTVITPVYTPKTPSESKEQSRLPAVIEATPVTAEPKQSGLFPVVAETPTYPATTSINEQQRARFIRLFANTLPQQQQQDTDASVFRPLPKGVQQYLQIAALNVGPQQRLFDAIV